MKYRQGEVYSLDEIIEDASKTISPLWAKLNLSRYKIRYDRAMYLGVKEQNGNRFAVFGLLYPDGRPGLVIAFWRFNPNLHENVPVNYDLHKSVFETKEGRMRKLMESPEYKFMTKKKDENVPLPKTLKKPEIRKKIFEAIRKGDVEELERLKKEVEKPEPGKRSIAKKFEQAEKEEPEQVVPEPKKVTVEVPAEHVETLREIAEKHGWKIILGSLVAVLLMR